MIFIDKPPLGLTKTTTRQFKRSWKRLSSHSFDPFHITVASYHYNTCVYSLIPQLEQSNKKGLAPFRNFRRKRPKQKHNTNPQVEAEAREQWENLVPLSSLRIFYSRLATTRASLVQTYSQIHVPLLSFDLILNDL